MFKIWSTTEHTLTNLDFKKVTLLLSLAVHISIETYPILNPETSLFCLLQIICSSSPWEFSGIQVSVASPKTWTGIFIVINRLIWEDWTSHPKSKVGCSINLNSWFPTIKYYLYIFYIFLAKPPGKYFTFSWLLSHLTRFTMWRTLSSFENKIF